ncbi:hypothetical protein SNF32_13525 [Enterococcus mundtii]|nr:hypothetical protein [Enterococcus mundtii]
MKSVGIKTNEITSKKKLLDATLYANAIHDYLFSPFSGKKEKLLILSKKLSLFLSKYGRLDSTNAKTHFPWIQLSTLIEAFLVIAPPTFFDKEIKVKLESDYP